MNAGPRDNGAASDRRPRPVRAVLRSPTVRSAVFYGVMGIGFSGAHLLLAKVLPRLEYAAIALAVAILNLALQFAPLGADGVINRQRMLPHRAMLARTILAGVGVGAATVTLAWLIYGLDVLMLALLFAGIVSGGVTRVAAAFFQSRQSFGRAMFLAQSSNLFLLVAACIVVALRVEGAWFALAVVVGGYCVAGTWSWARQLGDTARSGAAEAAFSWREAVSYSAVGGAVPVLIQVERLLIPKMLSLEDLATFGVLAAIVVAPYRTLQMGANFTVLPRLRAVGTAAARRRLLAREALMLTALIAAGSVVLLVVTRPLVDWIYRGKFEIPPDLLWAAVAAGSLKAYCGLARGAAVAVCTTRELGALGVLVWVSVGIAVAGAAAGATWGLTGVVLGIASGWLALIGMYSVLTARHLRT